MPECRYFDETAEASFADTARYLRILYLQILADTIPVRKISAEAYLTTLNPKPKTIPPTSGYDRSRLVPECRYFDEGAEAYLADGCQTLESSDADGYFLLFFITLKPRVE